MQSNKNKGEIGLPQPPHVKPRVSTTQHRSQKYNHQYFDFNIPDSHRSYIHVAPNSTPTATEPKTITLHLADTRKELIKQKIKFRVKQEIWNLLKRKVEVADPNPDEEKQGREGR